MSEGRLCGCYDLDIEHLNHKSSFMNLEYISKDVFDLIPPVFGIYRVWTM